MLYGMIFHDFILYGTQGRRGSNPTKYKTIYFSKHKNSTATCLVPKFKRSMATCVFHKTLNIGSGTSK